MIKFPESLTKNPIDSPSATIKGGSTPSNKAPEAFVQVPLAIPGPVHAELYFGRLNSILNALSDQVQFRTVEPYRELHPDGCAGTVVLTDVPGTTGAIYAEGLGSGWGAAEYTPDQVIAAPNASLHQQIVVPPTGAFAGNSWKGNALIQGDSVYVRSATYLLDLIRRDGTMWTWRVGGRTVTCTS